MSGIGKNKFVPARIKTLYGYRTDSAPWSKVGLRPCGMGHQNGTIYPIYLDAFFQGEPEIKSKEFFRKYKGKYAKIEFSYPCSCHDTVLISKKGYIFILNKIRKINLLQPQFLPEIDLLLKETE